MEVNRTQKPQPRGKISFTLPKIEKMNLENGLEILFVQKKNLPIIQFTFVSDAGSRLDPNEKKGISNLLAALIDEGAGGLDSLRLNDEIESLGSSISIFSDPDNFFISMLTLTENIDRSLDLLSKIIIRPNLDETDFLREKRKILTRIQQLKDDPSYIASIIFEKLVYGENNPYGLPDTGTTTTVGRINLNDVKLFYETLLTSDNTTLIVVGNYEREPLLEKLNQYLKDWHRYTPPVFDMPATIQKGSTIYFINKENASQTELRIGHVSSGRNAEDFFAKSVMNNILGGQFSSRININLREDKGYTYGANSSFSYNRTGGYFGVGTAVKSENTGSSVVEIIKELKGIQDYITTKELRFAKSSIIRKYPSLFETYGQIGRSLANKVIHSLSDDYYNRYIDNIKAVTLDDVYAAARNNIFPEKLIILAVGERDLLLGQLESLAIGKVIELNIDGHLES
ncbi:MAG: pitrilysin family protein [Bacteroidota bacterium]|nr:pitrilysin family protein [Bacteroidota bacterium]